MCVAVYVNSTLFIVASWSLVMLFWYGSILMLEAYAVSGYGPNHYALSLTTSHNLSSVVVLLCDMKQIHTALTLIDLLPFCPPLE